MTLFDIANAWLRAKRTDTSAAVESSFCSMCVAVDEKGRTWTTIAGSERDGALMWLANHEL